MREKININTLAVLNKLINYSGVWSRQENTMLNDSVFILKKYTPFLYSYVSVDEINVNKLYWRFSMNHEVERYVGELKELRSEVEFMKARIKDLETELEWRTKYGEYMSHQANINASVHNYSYNRLRINLN